MQLKPFMDTDATVSRAFPSSTNGVPPVVGPVAGETPLKTGASTTKQISGVVWLMGEYGRLILTVTS